MITATHHGLCVADIDEARATLASIGFTMIQPNAPEPLVYADTADDEVGRRTCPDLGSPYRTHFVERTASHHQIDLIEIAAHAIEPRPSSVPLSGDLTVVMPIEGDTDVAALVLRPFFGDRVVVTNEGEPWATLHVAAAVGPAVVAFLTECLGVELAPVTEGLSTMIGVGSRIDVATSSVTPLPRPGLGKRYAGANHLRLLHRDLAAIDASLAAHPDGRWLLPPAGGFAFVAGPGGLTIELFNHSVDPPTPQEVTS